MQQVEIRVKGRIDPHWSEWLEGLQISHANQDITILTGTITDQTTLYGLISKLRDLGLALIYLQCVEAKVSKNQQSQRFSGC